MQAITLLTLVILAGFLFKKEKSPYARLIIGSVFGIAFFSVWPFVVYYIDINNPSETALSVSYAFILVLSLLLSFLLVKIRTYKLTVAIISLSCFLIIIIASQSYENTIKNKIAIHTGYYSKTNPIKHNFNHSESKNKRFQYIYKDYSISLDNNWSKQTDKGPMFDYFQFKANGEYAAELRPKCTNKNRPALPVIIKSINNYIQIKNMKADTVCYQKDETVYACVIKSIDSDNQIKRIRWINLDTLSNTGTELDFILNNNQVYLLTEIERVINSVTIKAGNQDMNCLALTEWL
ncbi:MAG: hypothetical protein DIZ80_00455 [endosymbiont of Galathealinum brachiosum]|uniref:Uncharacterized protein n=1 Tax=endosymbiont of Galathealinum brachiosum TaxID=2200906 RepID=A0A370DM44_9GAMM|nr:MAG: hypothetical protein DIZ80_00455 [endosymbiont of Galathealinum brachiosum]